MRIYLAASSGSAPLAHTLAGLERNDVLDLVMAPEAGPWRHEKWAARDGRTRLLAWSNETKDPRLLPPLLKDGERALGCPGYLGDAVDAERLLRTDDPGALADDLSGVFGVFRADQAGFHAITTAVRVHAVFYASAGETHIAGNRALLVHFLARAVEHASQGDHPAIRYDVAALQTFVRNGFFLSDDTPFEGVRALPAHTTFEVKAGARRIITRYLPAADPGIPRGRARRALTRHLVDSVVKAVEPLRAFSGSVSLSLTGGRDSRLVAAGLHAAGIPFRTMTKGLPDHADVVLGARISRVLGVEHKTVIPPLDARGENLILKHPLLRAWETVRFAEGMVSTHYTVPRPARFRIGPTIAGSGGEQVRGGYLSTLELMDPASAVLGTRVRSLFSGCQELLTESANHRAGEDLAPWQERAQHDALDALDRIYLYYRTGRWLVALRSASMTSTAAFHPLLDNRLNRSALAMSPLWRWSERPFHDAITRLARPLRDLPLAGKRWRYEAKKPSWLARRRGFSSRIALTVRGQSAGFDWRLNPDPPMVALLREQILDGPAQLFEIVDRGKIERLLSTHPLRQATFVMHVHTASVLLSGMWLSPPPETVPVRLALPKGAATGS
jgi:Asparagine synthase